MTEEDLAEMARDLRPELFARVIVELYHGVKTPQATTHRDVSEARRRAASVRWGDRSKGSKPPPEDRSKQSKDPLDPLDPLNGSMQNMQNAMQTECKPDFASKTTIDLSSGSEISSENPEKILEEGRSEEEREDLTGSDPWGDLGDLSDSTGCKPDANGDAKRMQTKACMAVLEHWASQPYFERRPKLTVARQKRVRARLAEGFSEADLMAAISGAAKDDWLMGRDPKTNGKAYKDIETVLRDAGQVERLMALHALPARAGAPSGPTIRGHHDPKWEAKEEAQRAAHLARHEAGLEEARVRGEDIPF